MSNIGDKVKHIEVRLNSLMEIDDIREEDFSVIGVSSEFIQLDGKLFPKLSKNKTWDFCHSRLNEVFISESKSDLDISLFGAFRISIYSSMTMKKIENKMNREFKKWLDEKIGKYGAAREVKITLEDK